MAILTLAALLPSCASPPPPDGVTRGSVLVVASFNFPESVLLAEIYAQALGQAGVPARAEHGLGPRELLWPALEQGYVDLVPEYLGSALLAATEPAAAEPAVPDDAHAALVAALRPRGVRPLAPAPAQNTNAVVMTRERARSLGVAATGDLVPLAPTFTLAGPPECPLRWFCLRGLEAVYGLRFGDFMPQSASRLVRQALLEDVADAGIMFTTDGWLASQELVALDDDAGLQPDERIVPVVREEALARFGPPVAAVVDGVSASLTTESLRFLNWRMEVAGRDPAVEARGWLLRHGVIPRPQR